VICLTVLGVFFIRRKRGIANPTVKPSGQIYGPRNGFAQDAELSMGNARHMRKGYHWDSSHGPVEMYQGHRINIEPAELPGRV
jgi:hypothetical protein